MRELQYKLLFVSLRLAEPLHYSSSMLGNSQFTKTLACWKMAEMWDVIELSCRVGFPEQRRAKEMRLTLCPTLLLMLIRHRCLTSMMSISCRRNPALSKAPRTASAGPMPIISGSQPTTCQATKRATGTIFLDWRVDSPAKIRLKSATKGSFIGVLFSTCSSEQSVGVGLAESKYFQPRY